MKSFEKLLKYSSSRSLRKEERKREKEREGERKRERNIREHWGTRHVNKETILEEDLPQPSYCLLCISEIITQLKSFLIPDPQDHEKNIPRAHTRENVVWPDGLFMWKASLMFLMSHLYTCSHGKSPIVSSERWKQKPVSRVSAS